MKMTKVTPLAARETHGSDDGVVKDSTRSLTVRRKVVGRATHELNICKALCRIISEVR